jgi:uncharacterized protein (DUF2062 family)
MTSSGTRLPIGALDVYPCLSVSTAAPDSDLNRTLWQRRVLDPIVAQLTQGITPEKIALTVAVGGALALFPVLGTTTLLCLLVGIMLRLNQPIIQMVNFLCAPIHIPLIYFSVRWGQWLFGVPRVPFSMRYFVHLLWTDPVFFFHRFGSTLFHAIVIWGIAAPFWTAAVYYVLLPMLREIARLKAESAAKALAEKPPDHPVP